MPSIFPASRDWPRGIYTLLPAHYALLPGAYAVKVRRRMQNLLPGQAYSRQDGIQVVPGYVTDSRAASGGPRDALWSGFEVLTREQVLQRSEITLTRASDFFTASQSRPQDAGLLSIATTGGLSWMPFSNSPRPKADGGRGGYQRAQNRHYQRLAIRNRSAGHAYRGC